LILLPFSLRGSDNAVSDELGNLRHRAIRVLLEFEFESDVVIRISGCDVKVEVKYGLSRDGTVV